MYENIIVEKISYTLSNKGNIQGYKWIKENSKAKKIVLISHGMAEHIERYDDFAKLLADNDYVVYGHNQRGHKDSILSKKDYGYMGENDNFMVMVDDLSEIIDEIKITYSDKPIILFGHSMGSFVSQRFTQLYSSKIDGLILCGSSKNSSVILNLGLLVAKVICSIKGRRHKSKLLNALSFGAYNKKFKPNRTEFDWLNSVDEEVDKYIADPYCGGIFSSAYFKDFFKGMKEINKNNDLIPKDLPILVISGEDDPVGEKGKNITKLVKIYQKKGISDVTFKLYLDARHEILLDKSQETVKRDILDWLKK